MVYFSFNRKQIQYNDYLTPTEVMRACSHFCTKPISLKLAADFISSSAKLSPWDKSTTSVYIHFNNAEPTSSGSVDQSAKIYLILFNKCH